VKENKKNDGSGCGNKIDYKVLPSLALTFAREFDGCADSW
jgi:hypothetical protein